eukprot:GHRQ01004671.1.p1 GENE.GHRQ01004671.1~~GHRQ01004671.1.p1  ORF type:complete len:219 (+),score=32.68 GHRQ01004671.1:154-810(+)
MQAAQLSHQRLPAPCPCSSRQPLVHSSRRSRRVQAAASFSVFDDGADYRELQQQGGPSYARPSWHPLLFRAPGNRSYEASVRSYYEDVWNDGCVEALDDLAAPGVVYSDTLGYVEDSFGISGLQEVVQQFQASHPLLKVRVDDIIIDEKHRAASAFFTATAAHLLPSCEGVPATGHISTVTGVDRFRFDRQGRCTSIQSTRQRFSDEDELQLVDWDTA